MPADRFMQTLETYVDLPGARLQRLCAATSRPPTCTSGPTTPSRWRSCSAEAGLAPGPPLGFREGGFPDLDQLEIREEGLFMETRPGA